MPVGLFVVEEFFKLIRTKKALHNKYNLRFALIAQGSLQA
jgi:hypothetical protein